MRKLLLSTLILTSFWSSATPPSMVGSKLCAQLLEQARQHDPGLQAPEVRPLTFRQVQVFRRNNNFGMQQEGAVEWREWISLPTPDGQTYNDVGLTEEGAIFHILHRENRSVGRLLSGERAFQKIFLYRGSVLGALDEQGHVYLYSAIKWNSRPTPQILRRGVSVWAAVTASLSAIAVTYDPSILQMGPEWNGFVLSIPLTMVSLSSALSTGLGLLNYYDFLNTFPDGFVKVAENLDDLSHLDLSAFPLDHDYAPFTQSTWPQSVPEASEPIRK